MSIKSAINEETGYDTAPFLANKLYNYNCPSCKTKVKLNKGEKTVSYFSHIKKENCNWYDYEKYKEPLDEDIIISEIDELEKQKKENETTYHKEGKILLKGLLELGYKISFERKCQTHTYKCEGSLKIDTDVFCNNSKVEIEYHMKHNDKSIYCDVAHLVNGEVKTIYEVYHTHLTAEYNRPNDIKWADIRAGDIIDIKNRTDISDKKISFICKRKYECEECKKYIIQREEERKNREDEERRLRIVKLEMEREKQRLLDEEKRKRMILKVQQEKIKEEQRIKDNISKLEKEKQMKEQEEKDKILKKQNEKKKEEERMIEIKRQQKVKQNRELKEQCIQYFKLWYLKTKTLRGSAKCVYMYRLKKHLKIYDYFPCCKNENYCKVCVSYRKIYKDFFNIK